MAEQRPARNQDKPAAVATSERPPLAPPKPPNGFIRTLRIVRTLVLLVLAIALLGAAPAALSGAYFGLWKVPFIASGPTPIPTTSQKDLALPRPAWVATAVGVHTQPGVGTPIATLQPGYPVTLVTQRTVSATSWVQVKWPGPTATSGGEGWATASAFTSYGAGTTPIGDLGAFSPSLASIVTAQGTHLAVSLYFPRTGYLFESNATLSFALGDGLRGPLLIETLSRAEQATTPTSLPLSQLVQIAGGDNTSCAAAYTQLGGTTGTSAFLTNAGVSGIQLNASDWSGAQANTTSLLVFYESLREGHILTVADRVLAFGLLQGSDSALVTAVGGANPLAGDGPLFVSVKQDAGGWTVSAVGVATVPGGEDYTVAIAASELPTQAAAQQAAATFLTQLAPLVAAA